MYKTWKYGDPNSTPTVVAAPRERYDVIYGDAGYRAYYQMWRPRREMVYVGANDGMLMHLMEVTIIRETISRPPTSSMVGSRKSDR